MLLDIVNNVSQLEKNVGIAITKKNQKDDRKTSSDNSKIENRNKNSKKESLGIFVSS